MMAQLPSRVAKLRARAAFSGLLCAVFLAGCAAQFFGAHSPPRAANVILLIGDGMGDAEITAARNYLVGSGSRLVMEQLPAYGRLTTFAVVENAPDIPDYVVDSAASATAWATGKKTSVGRLSTAAQTGELLPTILERAQQAGIPVGVVTTSEVTDATPAALLAHVNARSCQGPSDMKSCPEFRRERGGPGSIAEQIVAQRAALVFGGGRQRFEQKPTGSDRTLLDIARASGFTVVTRAEELHGIADPPILGLFASSDLDKLWKGEPARPYPGSGPQRCLEGQRPSEQPTLEIMTEQALRILERLGAQRKRPFFLQVEGANIDKSAHAAEPCAQIGETAEFDRTVALVWRYAQRHGNTLVIVTADHAHATQIVPHPFAGARHPGLLSTLVTREGGLLTLGYGTSSAGASQTHTGTDVPVFAFGPYSHSLAGHHDQTFLFRTIAAALDLDI
ncbi:MAG: alkaline phosphatase [Candidatus Binatia bacterium]|nr:MAG: alkaline phosphatase [Candidatus Binatia bacterium]